LGTFEILLDQDADEEDDDYQEAQTSLEWDFVVDLFDVTNIPIKWACSLCKDDYPNGDLMDTQGAINLKYNKIILQWIQKENENDN